MARFLCRGQPLSVRFRWEIGAAPKPTDSCPWALAASRPLFADAESCENAIQQIVGVDSANHGTQLFKGQSQLQCKQFRNFLIQNDCMGVPKMLQACFNVMPASH